jgi:hypothetical protein
VASWPAQISDCSIPRPITAISVSTCFIHSV